ncbi:hypothetical protein BH11PSE4_BH11PSE4_35290 [soil metagenome]
MSARRGTAFDCEAPASGFNLAAVARFSDVSATNSYRGFWTRNSCEYAVFSNVIARNNVFGMVVSSGNISVSGFEFVWNYNNLQIVGQANGNSCHGSFTGGVSNHGVYNLEVLSCGLGQSFSGVNFIGDQGGSLELGGVIRIANSRGINIVGGILGSKVLVERCDPVTGNCLLAGANKIDGMYVRDDVPGWKNPVVSYPGGLIAKNNFNGAGLVGWNN